MNMIGTQAAGLRDFLDNLTPPPVARDREVLPLRVADGIDVPPCFSRCIDHAVFYRRGWRDAQAGRIPASMRGYPAALAIAYAAGGMDALAEGT